jgi:hypothetical protein
MARGPDVDEPAGRVLAARGCSATAPDAIPALGATHP